MSVFVKLLAMDDLARPHGSGLNPRLRDAIERSQGCKSVAALSRGCAGLPGTIPQRKNMEGVCDAEN
ncbi:MAG: hypothetical protein AAFQ60_06845 [Pseudomonadota bacterium]